MWHGLYTLSKYVSNCGIDIFIWFAFILSTGSSTVLYSLINFHACFHMLLYYSQMQ